MPHERAMLVIPTEVAAVSYPYAAGGGKVRAVWLKSGAGGEDGNFQVLDSEHNRAVLGVADGE